MRKMTVSYGMTVNRGLGEVSESVGIAMEVGPGESADKTCAMLRHWCEAQLGIQVNNGGTYECAVVETQAKREPVHQEQAGGSGEGVCDGRSGWGGSDPFADGGEHF